MKLRVKGLPAGFLLGLSQLPACSAASNDGHETEAICTPIAPTECPDPAPHYPDVAPIFERRCASCHTDSFAGTKATARIAGQREEYLQKALHDYKSGVRAGGGMAAMADVAYPLSDEEITALAHYLAHL